MEISRWSCRLAILSIRRWAEMPINKVEKDGGGGHLRFPSNTISASSTSIGRIPADTLNGFSRRSTVRGIAQTAMFASYLVVLT